MINIIKERTRETITKYYIEFNYKDDPDHGFCFPANRDGTPALDKMCQDGITNYNNCLTDEHLEGPEFTTRTHSYYDPAIGKCSCGREVVLNADYYGATSCECGKWYNLFGQELLDPRYWEEDYNY